MLVTLIALDLELLVCWSAINENWFACWCDSGTKPTRNIKKGREKRLE
jgi:hypothetical protein